MVDVRPDARHIPAEIFEANRHRIHPAHIGREIPVRVEQCLFDLVVRREPDLRVQVQQPRPKGNHRRQRLGGERRANAEAECRSCERIRSARDAPGSAIIWR